jgi:RNA polymerase sigma-70 factor (ECF subfamily)
MNYNKQDVLLAIHNDKNAFERLYCAINNDLYKMAIYILGDVGLAEEAVSETVMDSLTGIAKLKDAEKFEQWILKILTVKCNRKIGDKYNRFSVYNPKAQNIDDCNEKSVYSTDDNEIKTDVQIALSKLDKKDRMIVSFCVVEGYKSHEVAEILSMNASTVRTRLNRSLAKMRDYLEVK